MLSNTLTLAQQLGATVFTYKGDDVVKTILQFAREYRVGHIVIGSPGRKVPFWRRLRGETSIVERLITEGPGLTVVVLDTRAILEERPTSDVTSPDEEIDEVMPQQRGDYAQESKALLSLMTTLVWETPIDKEEAIRCLLDSFRRLGKNLKARALDSLLEREQQGGTQVGEDVAIPHARVDGLQHPLVAVGVCRSGIKDKGSGQIAKIIILLLSPIDPPEKHLETLGIISRMAGNDLLRKNVLAAKKPRVVREIIQDWAIKMGKIGDRKKI
jgi:two-component system sensor histidine kinase KdpD